MIAIAISTKLNKSYYIKEKEAKGNTLYDRLDTALRTILKRIYANFTTLKS